jgi:AcrR family transcriptional regulator
MAEPSSRQTEILDALEAIYLREGFRSLGMGELASRLRCSRRTLYELAPTKPELFLLVLERFLARIRALGEERAAAEPDPRARIAALLEPGISETRRAGEAFAADVAAYEPARRMLERHQRARMAQLRDVLEEGIASGVFRGVHAVLVAEVMLAAVGRASDPALLRRAGLSMSEAFEECSRLIQHGLLHRGR